MSNKLLTTLLFEAITLVNNDRILNTLHNEAFIGNVFGFRRHCPHPRFDSGTVGRVQERAIRNADAVHASLLWPLTKASDADAMTGAAGDVGDGNVGGAVSDGNAVIAGSDNAVENLDTVARAYVHAVCVRTVPRRCYVDV